MTIQKYLQLAKRFFFPVLLMSVLFVVSSYYWSTTMVYTDEQLYDVRHGFPLNFFSTDFVMDNVYTEGIYKLPQKMNGFMYFGSTTIIWPLFLLSVLIMQVVFTTTLFWVSSIFPRTEKFFRFLSVRNIFATIGILGVSFMVMLYIQSYSNKFLPQKELSPGMSQPVDFR